MSQNTNDANIITGSMRNMKGVPVAVHVDEETILTAAQAATTVIMSIHGDKLGVSRNDILEFNVCSLRAALMKAIDPECRVDKRLRIPCYFDSMIKGLNIKMGRSVISASLAQSACDVPASYSEVVVQLKALNITLVRPHAPSEELSATLSLFREEVDGVQVITGNRGDINLEDIVRRSLIEVEEADLQILRSIAGELALQYGELDDLLVDYMTATVRTAV